MQRTVEEANNFLIRDSVAISKVDAAGESVTLTNTTNDPVSIAGWRLQAEKVNINYDYHSFCCIRMLND
jgi:hypothetical protein